MRIYINYVIQNDTMALIALARWIFNNEYNLRIYTVCTRRCCDVNFRLQAESQKSFFKLWILFNEQQKKSIFKLQNYQIGSLN